MPISLDEIRYGRLRLTKVLVDSSSPSRIINGAHDIAPEFLDIRPTLKNVVDRVTPARPTPFETEIVFRDDTTETGSTQQEASLDSFQIKCLSSRIRDFSAFETIMDDIRSRRYKLNKIMVDGSLPPRVKKDTQLTNLEFMTIRSTLKKVTNRVLRPSPKKILNPVEALMESIRQSPNLKLKHVRTKESSKIQGRRIISSDVTSSPLSNNNKCSNLNSNPDWALNASQETLLTSQDQSKSKAEEPRKRLIKPDPNLLDFIF